MYLREQAWLHEHGLVNSWADAYRLPLYVLEDARMLMIAEAERDERLSKLNNRPARRR